MKIIGIVDHGPSHITGLTARKIKNRYREIEDAVEKYSLEILSGIEAEVFPDGTLDIPPNSRDFLDFVVVGIHRPLNFQEYHKLLIKVFQDNDVDVLAHYGVGANWIIRNMELVEDLFEIMVENSVAIEINEAYLVPDDYTLGICRHYSLNYSTGSDAHLVSEVGNIEWSRRIGETYFKKGSNIAVSWKRK